MVKVRLLWGYCVIYGVEYYPHMGWVDVDNKTYLKVRQSDRWEVEGETAEETVEEVVDDSVEEEVVEETVAEEAEDNTDDASDAPSLDSLNKAELKAYLDEAGVEYDSSLTKAKLLELAISLDEEE
tara:strand:- start:5055 stop:5432 length:378 start_codon:yes stop_codon:yes gene_type:complete